MKMRSIGYRGGVLVIGGRRGGFTLLEMIIAIAFSGMIMVVLGRVIETTVQRSVTPAITLQSVWIARSYLDEIHQRIRTKKVLPCDRSQYEIGEKVAKDLSEKAKNRYMFSVLCEYSDLLESTVTRFDGVEMGSLRDYRVTIEVMLVSGSEDKSEAVRMAKVGEMIDVAVVVTHPAISEIVLKERMWLEI